MNAPDILKSYNLKRTACRELIVEVIMSAKVALSENEIVDKMTASFDRTTFYRSFKSLVESNVLHRVFLDEGVVKYALSLEDNKPMHQHAHFQCVKCKKVSCLADTLINITNIPSELNIQSYHILLKGVCRSCTNITYFI